MLFCIKLSNHSPEYLPALPTARKQNDRSPIKRIYKGRERPNNM